MSTLDLLRATAPHAPEELRARILASRPAERPRRRRVRPVLVFAAAAAVAVLAAVVHGFATSAPQAQKQPAAPVTLQGHVAAGGSGSAPTSTTPTYSASATRGNPQRVVALPPRGRLTHTDASIRVRVASTDELGAATNKATRIASSLGGWAQSVVYRTPAGGGGASYLELRVPADKVKTALTRLADLGVLVSQQISIEDLTSKLRVQSDEIAQLRRRVAALNDALRNPALPDAQRVLLQIQLAEAKRALSQRLHGRKGTLAAGATSRISLVLTTQKHAAAPAPHRGRLGRMLHDAVGFLAIEAMVALFALIVASPFAVAFGLLWFWRRRAVERVLME